MVTHIVAKPRERGHSCPRISSRSSGARSFQPSHLSPIIALLFLLATGCTTTKYIPVETVRTEYKDNIKHTLTTDSVIDTRFVYVNGDTIVDWRDRIKWRDRYIHDSVYVERNDTLRIPYPVERELTRWEQTKMDFGGMAIGSLVALLSIAVIWLIKRRK